MIAYIVYIHLIIIDSNYKNVIEIKGQGQIYLKPGCMDYNAKFRAHLTFLPEDNHISTQYLPVCK